MMRPIGLVRGQQVDLCIVMDNVPQIQARAGFQIARLEDPLQQQDRATPAQAAHAFGFAQVQQVNTVRSTQALAGPLDAVTIRIGLDDSPQFCALGQLAHAPEVLAQGVNVDGGANRAWHLGQFKAVSIPHAITSANMNTRRPRRLPCPGGHGRLGPDPLFDRLRRTPRR